MFAFDLWSPVVFVVALLLLWWLGPSAWRIPGRAWRTVGSRPWASIALVMLVASSVTAGVVLRRGVPVPAVTDEFSYLLQADTFAHGRVTNEPHALWQRFEAEEIIQQPTYQSKYPPGQGLFLALGQVLTGQPASGVWLSWILACGALCWMLQAWVGGSWALAGGLMAAVNPGMIDGWSQSYWGGAVAMLGGALLFGALRRLLSQLSAGNAALLACGAVILANSRPLEGLLACAMSGAALLVRLVVTRPRLPGQWLRKLVLPALLVLAPAAVATGYYNSRLTGSPFQMPYQVWHRTYVGGGSILRNFFFEDQGNAPPPRIVIGTRSLKGGGQHAAKAKEKRAEKKWRLVFVNGAFYLPGVLALFLVALPWAIRDRFVLFAVGTIALVFSSVFLGATIYAPHYSAPIAPLIILVLIVCVRWIHAFHGRGRRLGRIVAGALAASLMASAIVTIAKAAAVPRLALQRQKIIAKLQAEGGKHLIVVRYSPAHKSSFEWVYNSADIDSADIVWARENPPPRSPAPLLEYFKDRKLWLLDADPEELGPYFPLPSRTTP